MSSYSFPKSERLKSKRLIDSLFAGGKGGICFPIRYIFAEGAPGSGVSVMVSVSKKYHKKAVARNLLKRRMSEAYRLQKQPLAESGKNISLALLYVSNDILEYKVIEDAIGKIIAKISGRG